MGNAERSYERPAPMREEGRRLVLLRPVVEFDVERLKRLQDRMRDTRDP